MPRLKSFEKSRCLVTGASSGIGREIARQLVRNGANVLLTGRSADRLDDLARDLIAEGAKPTAVPFIDADLTLPGDRDRVIRTATENWGALDLVVNAAGLGATGHFETHDPSVLRTLFEINVFGLIEMTRCVLPLLRAGDRPSVVNLGSIVARRGLPGRSEYSASKFAVAGFTESIRAEWSKYGIHVLLLNPGFTATEFERNLIVNTARVGTAHKRVMTPDHVARETLKAIQQGRHELTLTAEGKLLLLVNRISPGFVDRGFARFTRRVFRDVVTVPVGTPGQKPRPWLLRPRKAPRIVESRDSGD